MAAAGLTEAILTTTNDNLAAVYFYQKRGFVIEAVLPGVCAAPHEAGGEDDMSLAGLTVRDEFRLRQRIGGTAMKEARTKG